MSDLAVTEAYFREPVDEEIANGPNIRKQPNSGKCLSEPSVLGDDVTECIVTNQ